MVKYNKLPLKNLSHSQYLNKILEKHRGQPIIVFAQSYGWNLPLLQRLQHIAVELAKMGYLYFFISSYFDNADGFEELSDNLYITNQYDLLKNLEKKIIHYYT